MVGTLFLFTVAVAAAAMTVSFSLYKAKIWWLKRVIHFVHSGEVLGICSVIVKRIE